MLHFVPFELNLLDRAIVELCEGAIDCDSDICWLGSTLLVQGTKAIAKDALLDVFAGDCALLQDELSLRKNQLEVPLWVRLQKVTASNFLYKVTSTPVRSQRNKKQWS